MSPMQTGGEDAPVYSLLLVPVCPDVIIPMIGIFGAVLGSLLRGP